MLLNDYTFEISRPPCDANAQTVNAVARLSDDIGEVLPYLNATLKGSVYDPKGNILTFRKDGRRIVLYPRQIAVTRLQDEDEARAVLGWVKATINETYEQRERITPSYAGRSQLKALDVYKLLPRLNCKACGESTCLAFAAKVVAEEAEIARCTPLLTEDYEEKREALAEMLIGVGYEAAALL